MRGNFDNTGKLIGLILRRERVMSTVWIILLLMFSIGLAPAMSAMFDSSTRIAFAETLNNPAMIAMLGPIYGIENYSVGSIYSNTMLQWIIITVAIMNIFLVVRHTRADEEAGRTEVVRSLPTGRLANLNATMITAVILNVVLAILTGLGIAAMGVESMDFAGSMIYGAALGASGLFFAAVAALFSQLSSSSRGAVSFSLMTLGVFYMMRAAGDMNSELLSLISPMGLIQRTQIYVKNYWWPVFVLLLETIAVSAIAYALNAVRDISQGFIPAKPGRREAPRSLLSPFGLAFRLLRTTLISWILGIFILGASYGSILGDIENFVSSSEFYSMIIGANENFTTAQMFVSMVTSIISLIGLVPVLTAALKLRSEEKDGRIEHVLSRAVSRINYLSGYTILAFLSSILVQLATAFGIYFVAISVLPDPGTLTLGYLIKANFVYLPAIWVMLGLAVLIMGLAPKATPIIWGYYGLTFFATFIARLPDLLPSWFSKITPYGYIPQLPVDSINYTTLAILTVIAAVLTAAGFVFYSKRDMVA